MIQYHCTKCQKTYIVNRDNHTELIYRDGLCSNCSGNLKITFPNKEENKKKEKTNNEHRD